MNEARMSGETDLDRLIASMQAELHPGVLAFVTLAGSPVPAGLDAVMQFREREGLTLIVPLDQAAARGLRHEYPCRMITLNIHSSLAAVGFLARITTALAADGISVNPVSAFYHDHLFVPEDQADRVMAILRGLSGQT